MSVASIAQNGTSRVMAVGTKCGSLIVTDNMFMYKRAEVKLSDVPIVSTVIQPTAYGRQQIVSLDGSGNLFEVHERDGYTRVRSIGNDVTHLAGREGVSEYVARRRSGHLLPEKYRINKPRPSIPVAFKLCDQHSHLCLYDGGLLEIEGLMFPVDIGSLIRGETEDGHVFEVIVNRKTWLIAKYTSGDDIFLHVHDKKGDTKTVLCVHKTGHAAMSSVASMSPCSRLLAVGRPDGSLSVVDRFAMLSVDHSSRTDVLKLDDGDAVSQIVWMDTDSESWTIGLVTRAGNIVTLRCIIE